MLIRKIFAIFVIALLAPTLSVSVEGDKGLPSTTVNLGFEEGELGEAPPGWTTEGNEGYRAELTALDPQSGSGCAVLYFDSEAGFEPKSDAWDALFQTFDATAFRGKKVRLRAVVRTENLLSSSKVGLRLDVRLKGGAVGFYEAMIDRPIRSEQWREYEIIGSVEDDAESISIGIYLTGTGGAWLDSVSLQGIGTLGEGNEPPKPLGERALANVLAFAKLYGHVRFFHPSDAVAKTDWEVFAVEGVRFAEGAGDARELASRLEVFFHPVAPTVCVWPSRSEVVSPCHLTLDGCGNGNPSIVAQYHHGVGLKSGSSQGYYYSRRVDNRGPSIDNSEVIGQRIEAEALRGERVRLRSWLRTQIPGDGGEAHLEIAVGSGEDDSDSDKSVAASVDSESWKEFELEASIPNDAEWIEVRVKLAGRGSIWVDDVALEFVSGDSEAQIDKLENPRFETGEPGKEPPGWYSGAGHSVYYRFTSVEVGALEGGLSVLLTGHPIGDDLFPNPTEPFVLDLGGGVSAMVPLALCADKKGALPKTADSWQLTTVNRPEGWSMSASDRATRLADVIIAWNVFQHFYVYFDVVDTDWESVLKQSLTAAATDPDGRAFLSTLRRLVAALHDGHAAANHVAYSHFFGPPVLWEWIEDSLVVTKIAADTEVDLRPGDVILEIDGRPAKEAIEALETLISGATPQHRRWLAAEKVGLGHRDTTLDVEIRTPAGVVRMVKLARTKHIYSKWEHILEPITEMKPGVFYLDLDRLEEKDFSDALPRLELARGIIMDVRGYLKIQPWTLVSHLIDEPAPAILIANPVTMRPDREAMKYSFFYGGWSIPNAPRFKGRVVVLTNGQAVSAAETFLGMVEQYQLADIVGGPSAGTNGGATSFTLPGGYHLNWTAQKVLKLDGTQHHGVGILPTVPVSRTIVGVAEGRDEVLERAITLIEQQ